MATKYVSSLTGSEMDSALLDMAYHNSEAYAVGTRNGVAVGSSDVTYHNNSKYWAEQVYGYTDRAEDAANRAESAVPSGTAGAVFFDRAQTLTSAQQAQARANIMAGGSNRNLLDNPWFTVNQRGFTSGTSGYISDRWTILGGTPTITALSPYGISVATSSAYNFIQNCWFTEADIDGKTLTLSANIDGEIQSVTFTAAVNTYYSFNFNNGLDMFRIYTGASATAHPQVRFTHSTGSATHNYTVYATKLELGSVSTLANDAPPEYATELRKCQYYYREFVAGGTSSIGLAWAYSATGASLLNFFGLGNNMRTTPTVTYSGGFNVQTQRGTSLAVTEVRLSTDVTTSVANVNFIVASGLTANQCCRVTANAGAKIAFSADI